MINHMLSKPWAGVLGRAKKWSGNPDLIWHHNANYLNVGQDIPDPICVWSGNHELIWDQNANCLIFGQDIPDPICESDVEMCRFWSQPDNP